MKLLEVILLILAYSVLLVTIFVSWVCYRRNLEKKETLFFAVSLLLLILSMTVSRFVAPAQPDEATHVFVLLAMIFVGLTTPLNVLAERKHKVPHYWKTILVGTAILLALLSAASHFLIVLVPVQYFVTGFLSLTIALSMLLSFFTPPLQPSARREKITRIFAITFIVLVPLVLVSYYAFDGESDGLKIGFLLPLGFLLLAAHQLTNDLNRLSLIRPELKSPEMLLENYALSEREKEITDLLIKGKTYNQISEALFISLPTVKTHAGNIYRKCGVKSRSELMALMFS